ncbi:LuxR C-terminal-related transcriptional regulator [Streptomyces sp. NPDC004549]|uniref:LuxR C-terminal-related transcriptional regulator n=1 Tax=Streptomyces sp. NPDC004549 TaxID=3154283 RepID=UPI0033A420F7
MTETIQLTQSERRVIDLLTHGATIQSTADQMSIRPKSVSTYLSKMRQKAECVGASAPVLVNTLAEHDVITLPVTDHPAPDLSEEEQLLLEAIARESRYRGIAEKTHIHRDDVGVETDRLLRKTSARTVMHLVALAHGWRLLGPHRSTAGAPDSLQRSA